MRPEIIGILFLGKQLTFPYRLMAPEEQLWVPLAYVNQSTPGNTPIHHLNPDGQNAHFQT